MKTLSASAIDQLADWGAALSFSHALRLVPIHSEEQILSNSFGAHSFACPASLKADLDHYAALHAQAYGESVDAVTLIPHMLEAFMAGDRGFKKKDVSKPVSQKPPQREATPP